MLGQRMGYLYIQLALLRSLGLEWNEAYHAWSKDGIPIHPIGSFNSSNNV
jgi:hypothetical protein